MVAEHWLTMLLLVLLLLLLLLQDSVECCLSLALMLTVALKPACMLR